jgi:hypothetical protein
MYCWSSTRSQRYCGTAQIDACLGVTNETSVLYGCNLQNSNGLRKYRCLNIHVVELQAVRLVG